MKWIAIWIAVAFAVAAGVGGALHWQRSIDRWEEKTKWYCDTLREQKAWVEREIERSHDWRRIDSGAVKLRVPEALSDFERFIESARQRANSAPMGADPSELRTAVSVAEMHLGLLRTEAKGLPSVPK
jgi:hypothetical protein